MVSNNLQMLLALATVLIVYESSLSSAPSHAMAAEVTASSLKGTEMDVNSRSHINKPSITGTGTGTGMFNRVPRHIAQGQQQQQHADADADAAQPTTFNSIKRSYSLAGDGGQAAVGAGHGLASSLNGLGSFSGLQHIRSGAGAGGGYYDAASMGSAHHISTHQPAMYTEAKPIYEDQQEHDYAAPSGHSQQHYGLGGSGSGGGGGGGDAVSAALHSAIYNLQTAGTHNGALGTSSASSTNNGGSDGFLPSWNFGKLSTSFTASAVPSTPYNSYHTGGKGGGSAGAGNAVDSSGSSSNNDKISEGNFLHHYESASGYNELTHQLQQQQQQQHQHQSQHQEYHPQYHQPQYEQYGQQQQQHDEYKYNYNSVEQAESGSSYNEDSQHHDHSNYLPSAPSGGGGGAGAAAHQHEEKQPDVINYVPYPVVKKLHVPVHEPVKIPVSHAVIIPISKPVPIHIPVTQNVQVPVEKDLKIPVERLVPYPVEKHVPVPVEKRVPYTVVKYVPIKVSRPFPVKVPVFKTVLHKVKGWW